MTGLAALGEEARRFESSGIAHGDEIDGLAPRCRSLGTSSLRHLTDHGWQDFGRMVPTDEIKTLEGLVDEVERVPVVRVCPVRLGREKQIRELGRRGAAGNGGQDGALG